MNDNIDSQQDGQEGSNEHTPMAETPEATETERAPVVAAPAQPHTIQKDKPQATYFGHTVPEIRAWLFKGLLGCLITAATIAVVAILIGGMGDIAWRAVGTICIAILHIAFLFIILPAGHTSVSMRRSSNMIVNALLAIVIGSFFTAVAHNWELLDSSIAGKLYSTFIVAFISLIHVKALMDIEDDDPSVRSVVRYNYGALGLAALLVTGLIYIEDSYQLLSGFYGRLLAATFVVDVTLSIVVAVMHRLYMQKHPELVRTEEASKHPAGRIALIVVASVIGFFIVISLVAAMRWLR